MRGTTLTTPKGCVGLVTFAFIPWAKRMFLSLSIYQKEQHNKPGDPMGGAEDEIETHEKKHRGKCTILDIYNKRYTMISTSGLSQERTKP